MGRYKKRTDGRYQTKVTIGKDASGKAIRKDIYASSIQELEKRKSELQWQYMNDLIVKTPDMTLADYCIQHLKTYQATRSKNTHAMYQNIIEKHIVPNIGHIPVSQVCYSDVQGLINQTLDKPRTCQQILMIMRQISKSAIHDNLCQKDMCYEVKLPSYRAKEKRALTDLEKEAIKKAAFSPREQAYIYLIYFLGLRREEAIALNIFDFDFNKKTVNINKAIIFDGNTPEYKDTKSYSGNRINPLPDAVIPFLRDYIATLEGSLLITKQDGSMLTKSAYTKMWDSIIRKMNDAITSESEKKVHYQPIQGLTSHIFRHNYATMLYYSGISIKKAAALMGHSDINLIMKIYAHLDEEKENTVDKLNAAISL